METLLSLASHIAEGVALTFTNLDLRNKPWGSYSSQVGENLSNISETFSFTWTV